MALRTILLALAFVSLVRAETLSNAVDDYVNSASDRVLQARPASPSKGWLEAIEDIEVSLEDEVDPFSGDLISMKRAAPSIAFLAAADEAKGEEDIGELSRQVSNPVGALWLIFLQHDLTVRDLKGVSDNQTLNNFKIQPVMPVALTENWRLILRPVVQINGFDIPRPDGSFSNDFGLGDLVLFMAFSNSDPTGHWMIGFGPTWIFPTATEDTLGTDKWAVGPMALVFYLGETWITGFVLQTWFSFAGSGDDDVALLDLQYVVRYRVTPTVNVGFGPNVQYDFDEEDWSVPIGIGGDIMTMIDKTPVRLGVEVYYYVDQFDGVENQWGLRIFLIPVVPAPKWAQTPRFGRLTRARE